MVSAPNTHGTDYQSVHTGRITNPSYILVTLLALAATALAQAPPEQPIREIFVPFEDLNIILESQTQRVFLTRQEFDALVEKAKTKPQANVPHKLALVAAEYEAKLEEGRALIAGNLTIEVLDEGLFALPLDLAGVGIRSAVLDGQPAPLMLGDQQRPTLLVQGKGLHKLTLALTAPLQTAAAQQSLNVTLPTTTAARLALAIPGNIEVKGGAAVISRTFDMAANLTRLELLPQKGGMSIVMSLNNRLLRDQRVVVARSVLVDEVTQGYERIHATVSHRVLHGAVDKLRFAIPAGFEVTRVESTLLARWEEKTEADGRKVLEATLREPTTEQIVLEISANRSPQAGEDWLAGLANWKFPRLEPLDVAGQVAVVGLLVEDRLRPENIQSTGLLSMDAGVLAGAIPASVLNAEPGAPDVRQVVTYYAPATAYDLTARFTRPPAGLRVATNSLLVIGDRSLTLTGGFALTPEAESLFDFRLAVPKGWQVTQVTRSDGTPLAIERFPTPDGGLRIVVRLASGIEVGKTATVNCEFVSTPAGWLADWTTQTIDFPQITVEGATQDTGAVAAQTLDDLVVRPDKLEGLTPLLDAEKAAFGLAELPTALAYRYQARPFSLSLAVERTKPSLMAEVYSFFRIERDNLIAHYELNYDVREARTRRVYFLLPSQTPTEIAVRGLGDTVVKEFRATDDGASRRWEVQLAERQIGRVRLAVDFQQQYDDGGLSRQGVPLIQATEVEYQSALVAVEGDEELDLTITTTGARPVDVGELAGAEYQVGRRVIGAFGYVGNQASVLVNVSRREPYALPPALVQKAQLTTKVSVAGRAQSLAQYDLLTKATLLEIRLPPGSTLWTIYIDDQPTKPQREGDSLLLSLPAQEQLAARKLKIVYESPGSELGFSGLIDAAAPVLLVRAAGMDEQREIPQADLEWTLHLPTGYSIRRANGTVYTDVIGPREPAALAVLRFLYDKAGGVTPFYVSARESARQRQLSETNGVFRSMDSLRSDYYQDKSATSDSYSMPAPAGAEPMGGAMPPASEVPADAAPQAKTTPPNDDPFAEAAPRRPAEPERETAAQQQATQPAQQPANAVEGIVGFQSDGEKPAGKFGDSLQGVSSLRIDLASDHGGQAAVFRSLGADPVLRAAVIDNRRVHAAAWGLALLVLLVGIGMTFQPAHHQASYVIVVLLASSIPLLLTDGFDDVAQVLDYVFFAGCALVAYFPLAAFVLAIGRWSKSKLPADCCQPEVTVQQITGLIVAVVLALSGAGAIAQEPSGVRIVNLRELLPLLEDAPAPVAVPADAIIIPYDPDKLDQRPETEKLLVPYDKYIELWNRANPDKKIVPAAAPPADFALAGAAYEATLASADSLQIRGTIEIDVFSDKPVAVPLHLAGGVLVKATVDGGAARLQVVGAAQPQAANPAPNAEAALPPKLLLLHLSGKGRKKLELTVQLGLSRQGGWRVVRGQLPVGPATALTLLVPIAGTEVRQQHLADRPTFETKVENEKIETSLGAGGLVDLQWRPKVTEGQVDQSLTAKSTAVLDVREDSLRLVWQARLEFGRAFRDAFTFAVPADFLVEQVTSDNLRGWSVKSVATEQMLDVTLLKPAQGTETITIQLARRGRVGQGDLAEFTAPSVLVVDAALQQGEIAVRRSPRLDLRTVAATGLSRADADGQTAAIEQLSDTTDAAVLNVRPYQTFRFVRPPFSLRLAASELPVATTAEVRAALRIAERDTTLDAAVVFRSQGQPLYRVELYLPQGFQLDRLGPGDLEWAITTENDRQKLTVHLLEGRTGDFTLTLFGRIVGVGDPPAADGEPKARTMPVPVIEVLGVQKQEGDLVVLPDPDTDVRMEEIKNADSVLLMQAIGWLAAEQQHLAKGALRFRSPDYGARLVLTPRTPLVSVRTITNVKVTPRAIQETILLNFKIEQAGIRRLSFLLPESLAKARLNVKLLKSRTVEPATNAAGQPIAGWVRFRLELQDYVRDEFGVIVMHDRLLTADKQPVAIPQVETGRTDQRLVAIENTGRDEVVVAANDLRGLEPLSPQQQAWRDLTAILGSGVTQAWLVSDGAATPSLAFQTKERVRAETAAARIDLATTIMVVDAAGTYRALQEYRVTNFTEQFLDVQLPAGARLWTVTVAGLPVKPLVPPPPAGQAQTPEGMVRIPLIKLAEGEGDYPVQLKYGGRLPEVASLAQVDFPLMRTININVELSQVKLMLPESHEWFDFRGSMRKVSDEGELAEVFQSYLSKRIQAASELLTSANPYTQIRAQSNLKQAAVLLRDSSRSMSANNMKQLGIALQTQNESLLAQAEKKAQEQQAEQAVELGDNRDRLNSYWADQGVQRSKNVVSGLKSNFDADKSDRDGAGKGDSSFNKGFFDQNALATKGEAAGQKAGADAPAKPAAPGDGKAGGRYFRGREGKQAADDMAQEGDRSGGGQQTQNPQLFNEQQKDTLQKKLQKETDERRSSESETFQQERANLSRYGQQLDQSALQQEQLGLNAPGQSGQFRGQGQPLAQPGGAAGPASGTGPSAGMGGGMMAPGMIPPGTSFAADPNEAPQDSDVSGQIVAAGEDFTAVAAGLASLDFTLPVRGKTYHFTTPRGQIEISARPLAETLVARLIGLAGLAVAILIVWLLARKRARVFWRQAFSTVACGVLIAVVGLVSVVSGIFPLAGLLLLAGGILLAIHSRCCPPAVAMS